MLILSAQNQSPDEFFGQESATQSIHAFSDDRQMSGYTPATPGCIIADGADIPRLLAAILDGTPVTVRG